MLVDGVTGALMSLGLVLLVIGSYVTITGRPVLVVSGRKRGLGALVAACVVLTVAGNTVEAKTSPSPAQTDDRASKRAAEEAVGRRSPANTSAASKATVKIQRKEEEQPATAAAAPTTAASVATGSPTDSGREEAVRAEPGTALATLHQLEIESRAPKAGYDRDLFGYRSYDVDRNGCDVRIICTRGGESELTCLMRA